MSTLREPFRIRAVEPIRVLSRAERREKLDRCGYNLHRLSSGDVAVDLQRDSGSGAFTLDRIAALLRNDDAEAGARAGSRLDAFVRELTGFRHVVPTRQAAAAEWITLSLLATEGRVVLGNALGERARANLRFAGASAHALLPLDALDAHSRRAWRGSPDAAAIERRIASMERERVACVLVALPSDPVGGQPVSLDSLRATRDACRRHRIPLWLDASRFAENAFLARQDDPALRERSVVEAAREAFACADGAYLCGPRDAIASSGGFIALNDDPLAERCATLVSLIEGPSASSGLARDAEMLLLALRESLDEPALAHRHRLCSHLAENLEALGVPIVQPAGCDSVYVDAARFLPHVPRSQFPGQALACALYVEGGVRGCEVGSLSLGGGSREEASADGGRGAPFELLRLSLTGRAHTAGHVDYVVELLAALIRQRGEIRGLRIVKAEAAHRQDSVELEPVP